MAETGRGHSADGMGEPDGDKVPLKDVPILERIVPRDATVGRYDRRLHALCNM